MMSLLEQQRLQTQALLAKAEEETTRANLVGELFAKVLSEEPSDVLPLLEEVHCPHDLADEGRQWLELVAPVSAGWELAG